MPAGPELDRLVHNVALGLADEWTKAIPAWRPDKPIDLSPGNLYFQKAEPAQLIPCPGYSTDIADAWMVVEVLRARGFSFTVGWTGSPAIGWKVSVAGHGRHVVLRGLEDKTGCVLICRAALLIVGEDPDGL